MKSGNFFQWTGVVSVDKDQSSWEKREIEWNITATFHPGKQQHLAELGRWYNLQGIVALQNGGSWRLGLLEFLERVRVVRFPSHSRFRPLKQENNGAHTENCSTIIRREYFASLEASNRLELLIVNDRIKILAAIESQRTDCARITEDKQGKYHHAKSASRTRLRDLRIFTKK